MPVSSEIRNALPHRVVVASNAGRWENWHGNLSVEADGLFAIGNRSRRANGGTYRKTVDDLKTFLALAVGEQQTVKSIGGGWSFSDIAASEDWLLSTNNLTQIFALQKSYLSAAYRERPGELFLVQGGCPISELNRILERNHRRSLWTSGASNGQTLAGAIATGTHGSILDRGAIHSHVRAIHLVTGPDSEVLIERESDRVVNQRFADRIGVELRRDDALFEAALVHLGALGFVAGLVIDTEPLFLLESNREFREYDAPLRHVLNTLDFSSYAAPGLPTGETPHLFMAVINPYDTSTSSVTAMRRLDVPHDYSPSYGLSDGDGPGYELLEIAAFVSQLVAPSVPALVKLLMEQRLKPKAREVGTLGETFDYSRQRPGAAGSAIGVPLAAVTDVLDLLVDELGRGPKAPLIFAPRFVRHSGAALEFTKHPTTCVIDIDGVRNDNTLDFLGRAWQRLDDEGIKPTQHWGKLNNIDSTNIDDRFGSDRVAAFQAARAELLPSVSQRKLFTSEYLRGLLGE